MGREGAPHFEILNMIALTRLDRVTRKSASPQRGEANLTLIKKHPELMAQTILPTLQSDVFHEP
jgi:hypothetical protein